MSTEAKHKFRRAFETLPKREREVAVLLYVKNLTLREIGEILGVSESRVCQIHSQLKRTLKAQLSRTRCSSPPSAERRLRRPARNFPQVLAEGVDQAVHMDLRIGHLNFSAPPAPVKRRPQAPHRRSSRSSARTRP
jgi:hypothetical protein